MTKPILIFSILWLFLAAVGAGISFLVFDSPKINHLVDKGVAVYGKVTAKEPEQHRHVYYTFEVNGKQYTGVGSAGSGNPEFEQLEIGQQVIVCYNPDNPAESYLGYPQSYRGKGIAPLLFGAVFFPISPIIVIIGSFLLYRTFKQKQR